jgi:hypothetical protein
VIFLSLAINTPTANNKLTTGAISNPKTATKFIKGAENDKPRKSIAIKEKIKHPLQIMANLDKKAKSGLNRCILIAFTNGKIRKIELSPFFQYPIKL